MTVFRAIMLVLITGFIYPPAGWIVGVVIAVAVHIFPNQTLGVE